MAGTATVERGQEAQAKKPAAKDDNTLPTDCFVANAAILEKKKFTYQCAAGSHFEQAPVRTPDGKLIIDPVYLPDGEPKMTRDGKPVVLIKTESIGYGPRRPAGDVFETNKEMETLNPPRPLPPKFVRLDEKRDPSVATLSEERRRNAALDKIRQNLLRAMNVTQLREYAESEGIDIGGANKAEEMVRRINAAQVSLSAAAPVG